MMNEKNLVDEYLNYIGYNGDRKPTLATLKQLQRLHTQTIPFENLNAFLNRPVSLDINDIVRKLLRNGRGGYCFEQNNLFSHVLKLLGYNVKNLSARGLYNVPEGVLIGRWHMMLFVTIEGEGLYITDVGFGGLSLTGPLKLEMNVAQETPHEQFRIVEAGEEYIVQANIQNEWKPLYAFSMLEQLPQDYEAPNFYVSCHPQSHFTYTLIAARPVPGKRYNLRNNELAIHHNNGPSEKRTIYDAAELKTVLTELIKINVDNLPELDEKLEKVVKG